MPKTVETAVLLEADAVEHLLNLDLIHAHHTDGNGFALEAAAGHGLQGRIVRLYTFGDRPFVIAIGKMILCQCAGQIFQKFDGVGRSPKV